MIKYILFGTSFALAAAIQPGPLFTYLFVQTIKNGWRKTLPAIFAPVLSDGPIIVLTLLILTRVPPIMISILQISGGLFLLYLAVSAARSLNKPESTGDSASEIRSLPQAVMINLLNPGPYIGWTLVMGPLLLKGWGESPSYGIALVTSFYSTMVLSMFVLILLFHSIVKTLPKLKRIFLILSSLALAGLGLFDLWLGSKSVL
jgi:threonine/homoserine/homoserine lactone efflux protein